MAGLCPVMEVNPVNISFESGFTGFSRLTITSPVGVGRLLLHGAFITLLFADA
ncbi:MAG: hypothetical protein ACK489_07630 [Bacteroidota bacterium]